MTLLAELIKKRESRAIATAIPAIPAIPSTKIAKIAKIARVNPKVVQSDGVANSGGKVANVAKVAGVNPQTDHTAEPTRVEKMHEIHLLANFVGANENWTEEELFEAKSNAENDLENALLSFRALARTVRKVKVLALLEADSGLQRAIYADTSSNQHDVILAIAVFGYATCEVRISKARYDPFQLLDLIEKYGHQTH